MLGAITISIRPRGRADNPLGRRYHVFAIIGDEVTGAEWDALDGEAEHAYCGMVTFAAANGVGRRWTATPRYLTDETKGYRSLHAAAFALVERATEREQAERIREQLDKERAPDA